MGFLGRGVGGYWCVTELNYATMTQSPLPKLKGMQRSNLSLEPRFRKGTGTANQLVMVNSPSTPGKQGWST